MDSIVENPSNSVAKDFSRLKLSTAGGHGRSRKYLRKALHCGKFVMFLVHVLCFWFLSSSALFLGRSAREAARSLASKLHRY